jgi:hypothetical protein
MSTRQPLVILTLVVAALHALTVGAPAATRCGDRDPKTRDVVRGVVSLKEESFVSASFGTSTDPQLLNLIFRVKGCELRDAEPAPIVETVPQKGAARQIPEGTVTLKKTVADGSEMSLRLLVDPKTFPPGAYGGLVELRAPYLVTSRIPVSLARSENVWLKPVLLGAGAGICGFFFFWLVSKLHGEKTKVRRRYFGIALGIACAVAAGTVYANYLDQEVWVFRENGRAAFLTGFAAATSGVMAGLVGLLYDTKSSTEATNGSGQPVANEAPVQTTTRDSGGRESG